MSLRDRSVSTCAIIRTTRGIEEPISSSRAQIRGTSSKPSWRAAYAGNSECRSEVAVKMMLMKSSTASELASSTSRTISATRSSMCSRSSDSSWVAPRTALTDTRLSLQTGRVEQLADFGVGQLAQPTRFQLTETHRPDAGPGQSTHRVPDLVEQPSHDAVASLVDDQLDDRATAVGVAHPRLADLDRTVLQHDTVQQLLDRGP